MTKKVAKKKAARQKDNDGRYGTHRLPKLVEIFTDCTTSSSGDNEIDLDTSAQMFPSRIVWVSEVGFYLVEIQPDASSGERPFPTLNTFLVGEGQAVLTEDCGNLGTFTFTVRRLDCPCIVNDISTPPIRVQS